jgi:hypothetical protein
MAASVSDPDVDYQARYEFLDATSGLIKPVAPIDALLKLLAVFRVWRAHLEALDVLGIIAALHSANRTIPAFDDSKEAEALRNGISEWMAKYRFNDSWIADAALCTLFVHADGRAKRRGWYIMPPWEAMHPEAKDLSLPRRGSESDEDYLNRFVRNFRLVGRRRRGENANQSQPARWAVRNFFLGESCKMIGSNERHQNPDTIQKAVRAFSQRASLTRPRKTIGANRVPSRLP